MLYKLNNKGSIHLLSLLFFILAVYGVYSLYKSYRNDHLREDLMEALEEGKTLTDKFVTDREQREKVDAAYRTVKSTINVSSDLTGQEGTIREIIDHMRELAENAGRSMGGRGE